MMSKRFVILLCAWSLSLTTSAEQAFDNPKNWQANSNGKMTISYDNEEKAVRFDVKFPPGKDLWAYPKIAVNGIPPTAKSLSFETRASQDDHNAGYRCGYVMFAPVNQSVRYQPSNSWQTIVIDLESNKINLTEVKTLQIGLNPQSPGLKFWLRNLKFLSDKGTAATVTVKPNDLDEIKKNTIVQGKWESPAIPPIADAGGFFQVKKNNGTWWFVDPAGKPFYSVGLNYCKGVGLDWPPREVSEYKKIFLSEEPLCQEMSKKFKQWQFNTCGPVGGNWNGRFPATPVFRIVHRAQYLADKGEVPKSKKYNFVDVYSEEFKKTCDDWAQRTIKPEAENPLIIGWFIDNEFHLPQDEDFQKQFYETVIAAIRKYDKNHLLLGTRFEAPNRSDLDIRMVGKYCDVLSVNYYDYPHDRKALLRLHELSGKPLLIGEFTSAAKENGSTNSKYWKGSLFENQTDRAKGYERYASDIAELPYIVGAHFFMFTDRNEPKINNWGLRDQNGKLYYDFVRHLPEINQRFPLIHDGKVKPRKFPDLKCAVNDNPHTENTAVISKDGKWLWQMASLYYGCTTGAAPFYFERDTDENWGFSAGGFIEYRFDLKQPLEDAHLIIRYASFPDSVTHGLNIEINDENVAVVSCPKAVENLTSPEGWAYGFGAMKLTTVSVPLKTNIPAGFTNVRFSVIKPWKPKQGVAMQGFFLSSGPYKVDPDHYYSLKPAQ